MLVGLFFLGCDETITPDQIEMCEARFFGPGVKKEEARSPHEEKDVLECHNKAMRWMHSISSRDPAV